MTSPIFGQTRCRLPTAPAFNAPRASFTAARPLAQRDSCRPPSQTNFMRARIRSLRDSSSRHLAVYPRDSFPPPIGARARWRRLSSRNGGPSHAKARTRFVGEHRAASTPPRRKTYAQSNNSPLYTTPAMLFRRMPATRSSSCTIRGATHVGRDRHSSSRLATRRGESNKLHRHIPHRELSA